MELFEKHTYIGKTADERRRQWRENIAPKFDIFEKIRNNEGHGLVFIPYEEIFTASQIATVNNFWRNEIGTSPPECMCYCIFDKSTPFYYTGTSDYTPF